MRAKFINETLEFERTGSPKKSINIGKYQKRDLSKAWDVNDLPEDYFEGEFGEYYVFELPEDWYDNQEDLESNFIAYKDMANDPLLDAIEVEIENDTEFENYKINQTGLFGYDDEYGIELFIPIIKI